MTPIQGRNHMLDVTLHGAAQVPTWYVGLFEGDYTPLPDVTAATLLALATECTAYSSATRVEFQEAAASGGATSNAAALSEFTFTAPKTVYGCFITSAPTKGSTSGTLLSVTRFPSPQIQATGSVLRVAAGPALTSA